MSNEQNFQHEKEKLRTQLLSSVSHDLKTPLSAIIGSLSLYQTMYDRLPEAQRKELISTAFDEAQRLDSFITNILDLAKIEAGAAKLKMDWYKVEELFNHMKRKMYKFKGREVVFKNDAQNVHISMDFGMSEQALMNVIDNANKYSPKDSPIEIYAYVDSGKGCTVSVRDLGPGVPNHMHERIFDKYTRITREDYQVAGTGLGLALTKAIMQAQGGAVKVENHEEHGAIFRLNWPTIKL